MQTPLGLLYDSGLIYHMALTKGIKMGMGVEGGGSHGGGGGAGFNCALRVRSIYIYKDTSAGLSCALRVQWVERQGLAVLSLVSEYNLITIA